MENDIIWLPIAEYHNFYEVSSNGLVRSLDRRIKSATGQFRLVKGRTLIPRNNGCGYHFVTLCKNGETRNYYVHRLVASAFVPNEGQKNYVNHIDGNPINNKVKNLEWVNHSENVSHAYQTNLNTNKRGSHSFAVGVIDNTLGKSFSTIKEWCEGRGIKYSTGRNIVSGNNKSRTIDTTLIITVNNKEKNSDERNDGTEKFAKRNTTQLDR